METAIKTWCVSRKNNEYTENVSLILDLITSFISPQFNVFHDDEYTSILIKRADVLPPNWNELLKYHDSMCKEELINNPLEAAF